MYIIRNIKYTYLYSKYIQMISTLPSLYHNFPLPLKPIPLTPLSRSTIRRYLNNYHPRNRSSVTPSINPPSWIYKSELINRRTRLSRDITSIRCLIARHYYIRKRYRQNCVSTGNPFVGDSWACIPSMFCSIKVAKPVTASFLPLERERGLRRLYEGEAWTIIGDK